VVERLLLIGMMGSGKTTVGALLARRLGWRHLDSDAQVEAATGMTVPAIFAAHGEAAFRAEETKALAKALTSDVPVVVSVAGGAVLDPDNRRKIRRGGTVVWLRVRPDILARRVGDGRGRPLLEHDPARSIARLEHQRRPVYAALAHLAIDVDQLPPAMVAERVLGRLGSLDRQP
jgi:shikimate kinase